MDAYSYLGLNETEKSTLVVSKEYGIQLETYSNTFQNISALASWVKSVKDPLLLTLDSSNQNEIFNGKSLVVLALVDPDANKTKWSPALEAVVKNWKSSERSVIFVWLDSIQHSGYVERVYSIKPTELPRLVIADPKTSEFYNVDAEGNPFIFEETKILSYLSDIMNGKLAVNYTKLILGSINFWIFGHRSAQDD